MDNPTTPAHPEQKPEIFFQQTKSLTKKPIKNNPMINAAKEPKQDSSVFKYLGVEEAN